MPAVSQISDANRSLQRPSHSASGIGCLSEHEGRLKMIMLRASAHCSHTLALKVLSVPGLVIVYSVISAYYHVSSASELFQP
jgi:hypothetical protein